jgi:tetratricopeptide (TPR) repeat protein
VRLTLAISCLVIFLGITGERPSVASQERSVPSAAPSAAVSVQTPVADADSGEPYVVELLQNKYRFEANGTGYHDFVGQIRIKSENAIREFGVLVYPFAASFESLEVPYVRVRKPNGTVVDTPASEFQELDSAVSREAPMYTDGREKHIAVKDLTVGDVLEIHVRWVFHDAIAPGNFWFDHNYFKVGACKKEILEVDVAADQPIKMRHSAEPPVIHEEGGRRFYRFEKLNGKRLEASKIPDWEKNYLGFPPPDVQFTSFKSWEDVGRWFGDLLQAKLEITPAMRAKSEELTKEKSSEEEKIRAIYDYVSQHFRYIGIDLGAGRYTPHAASDVLANRYGDCKDKHILLAALLAAAGIPANAALISSKFRIDPGFPSPSLFDHVITAVPRGPDYLFLDTTPELAPFGLLVDTLRGRQALVILPSGNSRLVGTPANPPFPSYETFQADSSIDANGGLQAKMSLEDRGDAEVALRTAYRATPRDRWQELTQELLARMGFGGTVSDVSVAQPEDTAHPFWIKFSYTRPKLPDWETHRILLPTPMFFLAELNEEQLQSKEPLPVGTPQDVRYEATVKLPPGVAPMLPENVERKTEFAEFTANYSVSQNTLHGTLHFKTLQNVVPGSLRSAFSSFAKLTQETERRYIFVQGNFGEDLAAFFLRGAPPAAAIPRLEEALAADPNNNAFLLRLSQAYRENGRPTDAVAILEKAIAAHDDAPPHLYMALGLSYMRVPEVDKALGAFQKALGDNAEARELNEAAYALGDANVHLSEALEYSKRAVADVSSDTMDVEPEKTGHTDFARMTELAADWDTLGWIKFRIGDYSEAEKYLGAAWDLMQTSVVGEHLVEAYERLGQKEKAAVICNMASVMLFPEADKRLAEKLGEEMNRLRPLLKAKAGGPGKAFGVDGHVALTDLRMFEIPLHGTLTGKAASAQFLISMSNESKAGKVERVVFLSGAQELRPMTRSISMVKYPQRFPDANTVRVVRKATLNCNIYSTNCTLVLTPSDEAAVALPDSQLHFAPRAP